MHLRRLFRDGRLESADLRAEDVAAILHDPSANAWGWIDLTRENADELEHLAERLDLHALAVEDAFSARERPKLMRYASHLLLTVTGSKLGDGDGVGSGDVGGVELTRLTAFILERLIITVRDDAFPIDRVAERLDAQAELAEHGVGAAIWALLDVLADDHLDSLERLDDLAENLSRDLFEDGVDMVELQHRAFRLRRSIATMRHTTMPLREVATTLVRRDGELAAKELEPYFADVSDHTMHAAEWTESLREQVESVLDTNIALQGNRMNLIMKKVTSWAAIIAVPTAITGYFGQNLAFPFFGEPAGWWISNALLSGCSLTLWFAFRRRDWL